MRKREQRSELCGAAVVRVRVWIYVVIAVIDKMHAADKDPAENLRPNHTDFNHMNHFKMENGVCVC